MKLPRIVRRTYQDTRNFNEYPRWWLAAQIGLGFLVVGGLLYYLITPDPSAKDQRLAQQWNRANAATVAPLDPSAPVGTDAPAGGSSISVPRSDGTGTDEVPLGAVDTAKNATRALFTGDFSAVVFAPGVSQPARLPQKWTSPQVTEPTLEAATAQQYTFKFTVDPDGPDGPEGARTLSTSVVNTDGIWGYQG